MEVIHRKVYKDRVMDGTLAANSSLDVPRFERRGSQVCVLVLFRKFRIYLFSSQGEMTST